MNAKKYSEVEVALNNSCLKSISYRGQLEQILQETKRDVKQIDWRHQVPHLLSEALEHIKVQHALEENIRTSAQDNLDHLR